MRSLLRNESGFSLPELLIVCAITVILMGGLATIFGIGLNTSKTTNSILASQSGVVVALDRLDYEARCASSATLVGAGAGVTLTLPSQCTHATGTVTWCVTGGSLVRYDSSGCVGTGLTLTTDVTSPTPFSCVVPVGNYPSLQVVITVNTGTTPATESSGTDTITLENAQLTTSSYVACS
jgi:prepilin-type N-terminal cleavage/methylation domain-containing protein